MTRLTSLTVLVVFFALLLALLCGGCQPQPKQSAATKQTIDTGHQKADVAAGKIQDQAKVDAAEVQVDPAKHPWKSLGRVILVARSTLVPFAIISFLALAAAFGLTFTPLSFISKIALPIAASVFAFSFGGIIALPFLPWIVGVMLLGLIGLAVYEIIRYKNIRKAAQAIEEQFCPPGTIGSPVTFVAGKGP